MYICHVVQPVLVVCSSVAREERHQRHACSNVGDIVHLVPRLATAISVLVVLRVDEGLKWLWPRARRRKDVIHYIDNSSALYGMTKGYSSVPDSLAIIRAFHAANLALRANIWFNYVATKANVADLPSRGALDEMAACLRKVLPSFSLLDTLLIGFAEDAAIRALRSTGAGHWALPPLRSILSPASASFPSSPSRSGGLMG